MIWKVYVAYMPKLFIIDRTFSASQHTNDTTRTANGYIKSSKSMHSTIVSRAFFTHSYLERTARKTWAVRHPFQHNSLRPSA